MPSPSFLKAGVLLACLIAFLGVWQLDRHDPTRGESFAYFESNVAPVLSRTCSATDEKGAFVCHGRPERQFAATDVAASEYRARTIPHAVPTMMASSCASKCHGKSAQMRFTFPLSQDGAIAQGRPMLLAYMKARAYTRYDASGHFAKILRMPLGAQAGGFGLMHGGGEIFDSAENPEYQKLVEWVRLENARAAGEMKALSKVDRHFKEKVLPVLARNGCMVPACHVFNHSSFILDPGMPSADLAKPLEDHFSPEQVAYDRTAAKGLIQSLVYLTGDVRESRILKKAIPMSKGGVLHRGGNDAFFASPDDPDYKALEEWLRLERTEAASRLRIGGKPFDESLLGKVRGIVFVRTRSDNHRRYLDIGKYLPGGDLFLLKIKDGETLETAKGPAVNLTARFHPGRDADVRKPCVRYDGKAVLFAMRVGESDNLNIYEIGLDDHQDLVEGSFRRLTYPRPRVHGLRVHCTDPIYVPDPTDDNAAAGGLELSRADICFASNMAGEVVPSAPRGIVGQADSGDASTIVDGDRPEPDGSFVGRRIQFVDGTDKGQWRSIVGFSNRLFTQERRSVIRLDRPLPYPVDASTVYVIEADPASQPGYLPCYSVYGMKYVPENRDAAIDRHTYESTITRITWNHGQDCDLSVRSTGEVFYVSQRSICDKFGRPIFHMASCRRHLDTRFSFPTHHGNRSTIQVYADNHEMPSGIDIHTGMSCDSEWLGGTLVVSDHQFGPDLETKNPNLYVSGLFDHRGVQRTRTGGMGDRPVASRASGPALTRFVHKTIALFPTRGPGAVSTAGLSPGGVYRNPIPLPDGGILVAWAPGPIDLADPAAHPDFDLYVLRGDPGFQPEGGTGVPAIRKTRVSGASAGGMSDVEPYPIAISLKPKINAANRPREERLIRDPGRPLDTRPAHYLERNYLLIDAIMRDPTPVGKHVAYAHDPVSGAPTSPIDQVKFVRFVEAVPMTPDLTPVMDRAKIRNGDPQSTLVSNGIHPMERMVVETPVHPDGSVSCKLPSNTALIIQSLNGDRMALRQEARTYFFVPNEPFTISPSPSETFQTCAMCMGSLTGRPRDIEGPTSPFLGQGLVNAIAQAERETGQATGLRVEDRLAIDFVRDIQPVLDAHCTACHAGPTAAAGLSLTGAKTIYYTDAYESLMQLVEPASGWYGRKRFVDEREALAIRSPLVAKLYGRQLKSPIPLAGDAPHPSVRLFASKGLPAAPLTEADRMLIVRWIDCGATFRGPR